jgi:hypothetical protein
MREDAEYPVLARQEQDRQQAPGHADQADIARFAGPSYDRL